MDIPEEAYKCKERIYGCADFEFGGVYSCCVVGIWYEMSDGQVGQGEYTPLCASVYQDTPATRPPPQTPKRVITLYPDQ